MVIQKKWNQGFAFEIGFSLIEYAKSTGTVTKLIAKTDADNFASQRVLQKLGFQLQKSDVLNIYERQL